MKEKIQTTEAKAKELKGMIDKIINKAKTAQDKTKQVAVLRALQIKIPAQAVKKITGGFIEKFSTRNSGYTRIVKIEARKSDNAKLSIIEFV